MSLPEILNAILKGTGIRPTSYLLRWEPTLKNPLNFGLLEVVRCNTDWGVVVPGSQHSLSLHAGHELRRPGIYSILEFIKVQIRIIR